MIFGLTTFVSLRVVQLIIEEILAALNIRYALDEKRLSHAATTLRLGADGLSKAKDYTLAKYRFRLSSDLVSTCILLIFLSSRGFVWIDELNLQIIPVSWQNPIVVGLGFFMICGVLQMILSLPFEYYFTFKLEERFGFNRQNLKGFILDRIKGLALGAVLGGVILGTLLAIIHALGNLWWLAAWLAMFFFSLLGAWLYPSVLAPIFNKFTPIADEQLKQDIDHLAERIAFKTNGIFVMDASTRSTHGNAYFAGAFGRKRIVLFDTLLKNMTRAEVIAVLAHELGHFKLHHIRWSLIRSFAISGVMFYALSRILSDASVFASFGFTQNSPHALLLLLFLWFGVIGFFLQPITNFWSRKNEFAADAFALRHTKNKSELGDALLKLREQSQTLPISHPWYSAFYHSHPPLLERLQVMNYIEGG